MSTKKLSVLIVVLTALGMASPVAMAGKNPNSGVYPVNAHAFGTTYGELALKWWQWSIGIPAAIHPALDLPDSDCTAGQAGDVWFLAGNFGGVSPPRFCEVPADKALFFPILTYGAWAPTDGNTEEDLRATADFFMDPSVVTVLECAVDGEALQDLFGYRADSPVGSFGPNEITDVPDGSDLLVADGYWILLKPLSEGEHEIHFTGQLTFTVAEHGFDFVFDLDVIYYLTIVEEDEDEQ